MSKFIIIAIIIIIILLLLYIIIIIIVIIIIIIIIIIVIIIIIIIIIINSNVSIIAVSTLHKNLRPLLIEKYSFNNNNIIMQLLLYSYSRYF